MKTAEVLSFHSSERDELLQDVRQVVDRLVDNFWALLKIEARAGEDGFAVRTCFFVMDTVLETERAANEEYQRWLRDCVQVEHRKEGNMK